MTLVESGCSVCLSVSPRCPSAVGRSGTRPALRALPCVLCETFCSHLRATRRSYSPCFPLSAGVTRRPARHASARSSQAGLQVCFKSVSSCPCLAVPCLSAPSQISAMATVDKIGQGQEQHVCSHVQTVAGIPGSASLKSLRQGFQMAQQSSPTMFGGVSLWPRRASPAIRSDLVFPESGVCPRLGFSTPGSLLVRPAPSCPVCLPVCLASLITSQHTHCLYVL